MPVHILIVDDDPEVVETLRKVLRATGYRTIGVTDFEEARRVLQADPHPDVLITDVRLGQFNGLQLVLQRPPATAAIVMSGFVDPTLQAEAHKHGGRYLVKPIRNEVLVAAVQEALDGRSGQPDAVRP